MIFYSSHYNIMINVSLSTDDDELLKILLVKRLKRRYLFNSLTKGVLCNLVKGNIVRSKSSSE